jgi:hypothetical protein
MANVWKRRREEEEEVEEEVEEGVQKRGGFCYNEKGEGKDTARNGGEVMQSTNERRGRTKRGMRMRVKARVARRMKERRRGREV